MSQHGRDWDDDVLVLPPLPADPLFVEAVDDAIAGAVGLPEIQPKRTVGADPRDFASLYIRHRTSFGLHARRFLNDQRDVDEVLQEAFLRLFLAMPELDTELQALSYCRRTVTNLCIDRYRAEQRRPRLVDLDALEWDPSDEDSYDDPVLRAEDAAIVREALALLSPLHRAALVKREIEEKSLPQIAVELDVAEESVKHLLYRARRSLRRLLVGTSVEPGADLTHRQTLRLAHERLARVTLNGANVLIVMFVAVVSVVVGLRPTVTVSDGGGRPVAPTVPAASPGATLPIPHGPATPPRRRSHAGVAPGGTQDKSSATVTPAPVPSSPASHSRPSSPYAQSRSHGTWPGSNWESTRRSAGHYSLRGSLEATGPVQVRSIARVIDAGTGTTATSRLTAPTTAGTFALTQTVTQSAADGSASVSLQPALIRNGNTTTSDVVSTSAVSRDPSGTLTVDVTAKTVDATTLPLSDIQVHMVLAGDLVHVVSEDVVIGASDTASQPSSPSTVSTCSSAPDTNATGTSVDVRPAISVIGMSPEGSDDPLAICSSTTYGGSSPLLPTPPVPVSEGRAASS